MQGLVYDIAFSYLYRNRLRQAHHLLSAYKTAEVAWHHLSEEHMEEAMTRAQRELEWIDKHEIKVYKYGEENFPYRLQECPDAPLLLYGKGNLHFNEGKMVSIVGTRRATERGRDLTRRLVLDLKELVPDVTIVSGLAYGIDVASHRAALEAGLPTIIIPGHGLDRIYPPLHRDVAVGALRDGGLLTEYMSGTEPIGANFIARDRIIAGMADAVVVVESKDKGGSLITARMALDYDRQLFAFPGRVTDENSRGCNALIRDQKAALIESAEDLVDAMMWEKKKTLNSKGALQIELPLSVDGDDETGGILLSKLREEEDGIHINALVMETGLAYHVVSAKLMMMEIQGLIRALPGGMYRVVL